MERINRRQFVIQSTKILAFIPLANVMGCISDSKSDLSQEDSLKKLICILGPWSIEDLEIAEDFAGRFINSGFSEPYISKSNQLLKSILNQLSEDSEQAKEISLDDLKDDERQILMELSKQLYSFVEVRFQASNEPEWGLCQGDPKWHTRIPENT